MIDVLMTIVAFVLGYLLGSINTSIIVGRMYGTDIRSLGSKSAGLTKVCSPKWVVQN